LRIDAKHRDASFAPLRLEQSFGEVIHRGLIISQAICPPQRIALDWGRIGPLKIADPKEIPDKMRA